MHLPPAASHRVVRSRWHVRVLACLAGLGGLTCLGFALTQPLSITFLLLVASCLTGMACALRAWRHGPSGVLRWDGQYWHWTGFDMEQTCRLVPILDLQSVMLVQVRNDAGHKAWLWLEALPGHGNWMALRRAVFGSQRAQNAPGMPADPDAVLPAGERV